MLVYFPSPFSGRILVISFIRLVTPLSVFEVILSHLIFNLLKINEISDNYPYLAALINIYSIMNNGTVKFYDETRGFGFIADADSSEEYFVHSTGLDETIKKDDTVTYELKQGKKGLNAVNVKLA